MRTSTMPTMRSRASSDRRASGERRMVGVKRIARRTVGQRSRYVRERCEFRETRADPHASRRIFAATPMFTALDSSPAGGCVVMPIDVGRAASLVFAAAITIAACGGSSPSGPSPTELRVAGTYDTAVTLQQNGCTGITVQRFATTVAHVPGSSSLTITHAGNSYTGIVQRTGGFATTPKAVGGASETHTLTIAGTFTTTAIDATVVAV